MLCKGYLGNSHYAWVCSRWSATGKSCGFAAYLNHILYLKTHTPAYSEKRHYLIQAHTSLCGVFRTGWLTRFYTPYIFYMIIEFLITICDGDTEISCRYIILAISVWVIFVDLQSKPLRILTAGVMESGGASRSVSSRWKVRRKHNTVLRTLQAILIFANLIPALYSIIFIIILYECEWFYHTTLHTTLTLNPFQCFIESNFNIFTV